MRPKLIVTLLVALGIAGCGSTRVLTVVKTTTQTETRTISSAAISGRTLQLPASSGQDQCEVAHGTAQIIFFSQTVDVRPLCRAQISTGDWVSGYESASGTQKELLACYLSSSTSGVVASIFDTKSSDTGVHSCMKLVASRAWVSAQVTGS